MVDLTKKRRPEFRNIHYSQILQYRLPIAGIMSILHRASGGIMFLLLPLFIYLFDLSLTSEMSYARLMELTSSVVVKLILCGLAWAFIHHIVGGIRHLINDMHIGITKEASPKMAWAALTSSLVISFVAWLFIFGAI